MLKSFSEGGLYMSNGAILPKHAFKLFQHKSGSLPSITTILVRPIMTASRPPKLHGRAFYERLGSPKLILAPMVDRSDFVSTSLPNRWRRKLTSIPGVEGSHKIILR